MEKHKNSIDNLFREVLQDHEIIPSGRAKEAFLKEASGIPQRRWYRRGIFLFIVLASLGIIGGSAIYFLTLNSNGKKQATIKSDPTVYPVEQQTASANPVKPMKIYSNNIINETTPAKTNQTLAPAKHDQENEKYLKIPEYHANPAKPVQVLDTISNHVSQITEKSATSEIILPVMKNPSSAPESHESSPISPTADTSRFISKASYDTTKTQPPLPDPDKEKKQRLNKDWYFSGAVQYTPEWMFNTIEESKFVNNFGIEGIFTIGNYSIRTGLGLSITKGTNELVVEYNDFLGSYNKLDSMSFSWDGATQDYIPSYYMSNQDVWDSLMKLDYPKVVKRYTYLQIPLILGYDFLHSGKFTLGLRAGPLLSILLHSKQLTDDYDPGKNKVIRINNITPEQVSLNWQFMGGINASMRLSEKLIFEIEPMAKYYFNSVYEKSEITKKPWSIGIRAAFIIKF
jgi:hypothetical protein